MAIRQQLLKDSIPEHPDTMAANRPRYVPRLQVSTRRDHTRNRTRVVLTQTIKGRLQATTSGRTAVTTCDNAISEATQMSGAENMCIASGGDWELESEYPIYSVHTRVALDLIDERNQYCSERVPH